MKTYVGTIAKELWKETGQLLTLGNVGKVINMLELLGVTLFAEKSRVIILLIKIYDNGYVVWFGLVVNGDKHG